MMESNLQLDEWEKTVELSQTIINNLELISHKENINKEIKEDLEDLLMIIKIKTGYKSNFLKNIYLITPSR